MLNKSMGVLRVATGRENVESIFRSSFCAGSGKMNSFPDTTKKRPERVAERRADWVSKEGTIPDCYYLGKLTSANHKPCFPTYKPTRPLQVLCVASNRSSEVRPPGFKLCHCHLWVTLNWFCASVSPLQKRVGVLIK